MLGQNFIYNLTQVESSSFIQSQVWKGGNTYTQISSAKTV